MNIGKMKFHKQNSTIVHNKTTCEKIMFVLDYVICACHGCGANKDNI